MQPRNLIATSVIQTYLSRQTQQASFRLTLLFVALKKKCLRYINTVRSESCEKYGELSSQSELKNDWRDT